MGHIAGQAGIVISLLLGGCATAAHERALPLRKLRLYETGVGYFERAGDLGGGGGSLPVPSSHLDDALKSLVVLGAGSEVQSLAFDSRLSPAVARARAGLPADTAEAVRLHDVLLGLRGHGVVVWADGRRTRGRVVEVIGAPPHPAGDKADASTAEQAGTLAGRTFVLLITPSGRFKRFDVARITGVTPVDAQVRARMHDALDASRALRANARGMMDVVGTRGPVRIGYLAEAPVWRTTYRLVLGDAPAQNVMQGWALVHNDTDEDWNDVALELVNGRPDSFLYPLAAPRYDRRELVVPDRELSSVPQLLDTTADALWGDFVSGDGSIGLGNVGLTGYGSGSGGGSGYGMARGRAVRTTRDADSDLLSVGNLAALAARPGKAERTVFAYESAAPLSLRGGQSAMVPFLAAQTSARSITWVGGFVSGAARHAVMFENDTGQTLPEGTLAVFADGGFAGEVVLPRLVPRARRFLAIGDDPDTEMTVIESVAAEIPKRLVWRNDALQEHVLKTSTHELKFTNRSSFLRGLHIEVPSGSNAEISGCDRVDFDADAGRPLCVIDLAPGTVGAIRTVVVQEALRHSVAFEGLAEHELSRLAAATTLPAEERAAIATAAARLNTQAEARALVVALEQDLETLEGDIERVRGHVQAVGDDRGGASPLVARLLELEARLERRRDAIRTAKTALGSAQTVTRAALEMLAAN